MKKLSILALAALASVAACENQGETPEPEQPAVVETPAPEATVPAPEAAVPAVPVDSVPAAEGAAQPQP